MQGFDKNNKTIQGIRESIILYSERIISGLNEVEKSEILKELQELLEEVKEMQYDNCSVSDFEELVDEELVIDLLINKGMLDSVTANEIKENEVKYLKGEHTCSKLLEDILG